MSKLKQCSKCKKWKELLEFGKDKSRKDNLNDRCKKCYRKIGREWYKNNNEKIKKKRKKWRKNNPKKVRKWNKKYRKNNFEKVIKISREWKKNNSERVRKKAKEWKIKAYKTNTQYKLKVVLSGSIKSKLKKRLYSKRGNPSFSFLPYTVDELKQHLENQFKEWMNWDNWGNKKGCWSIDHIMPDSSFKYKSAKDKEFQECWALKNLRPLDHIENIRKNNKII